jgi:diguanylate cyclase (GGDEF)-like protein/PAS domain S-box-containing protein
MSRVRRRIVFHSLIWVVVGLIALAVVAIGATAWGLRSDQIDAGIRETDRMATLLADQTHRSVAAIDTALEDVKARVDSLGVDTPADFSRAVYTKDVFDFLAARLRQLPLATVITLQASDGQLTNSTRQWPRLDANFADRDYFQHLSNLDDRDIYISLPVTSRLVGSWTLYFNKRINARNGEFAGIVSIGVELKYFANIYESVGSVSGQVFLMLRKDGTVILRYPDSDLRTGYKLPPTSKFYEAVRNGGGNFRSSGNMQDGVRLVSVRPLPDYPLVVDVALQEATVLASWNRRMLAIGAGTLLVVCCAAFLLRGWAKQLGRLIVSEARLAKSSRELKTAKDRLDAAMNTVPQGLCMFDGDMRLTVANAGYRAMYGLSPAEVTSGSPLRDILRRRVANGNFSVDIDCYMADLRAQLELGKPFRAVTHLKDGRVISVQNQPAAGGGWVAIHEDITERQRAEAQIAHMARHDALTDLPNRLYFREEMDKLLSGLRGYGGPFNVLLFDLDLFKTVNDSLGHPIGDELLKLIADRLRNAPLGSCTPARIGGDEFAILQAEEGDQRENAVVLAKRLQSTLCEPYQIQGHQIVIGISIGIALAPEHGTSQVDLLKNADLALYRAKSGRLGYQFYEPQMDSEARLRRELEVDLREAVSKNEFVLHYQTIVDVGSRRVCGVEALVRWNHPKRGLLGPDRFIPIAEELGLIIPIGEWILRQACRDATAWSEDVRLAVNLSPVQFRSGNLLTCVTDALVQAGLCPARLELEVTESVLLEHNPESLAVLHQLKAGGVHIVLDDFGTGYSSLSYLRMFPFDKIKIDRSFVAEFSDRADCAAIVCAVTGLGRTLQLDTTAEGVETSEQFELLRAAGCTQAQGFLFSRPVPASALDFDAAVVADGSGGLRAAGNDAA